MKEPFLFFIAFCFSLNCLAQNISSSDVSLLKNKQDSLKMDADIMLNDTLIVNRYVADSMFTKTLVRALKTHNSFFFPFDSLASISRLYAPDSSFRIITWQLELSKDITLKHGAIQMRTADGSLKLFPLFDMSKSIKDQADTITDNKNWIGAMYYNLIEKKINNKNYYVLFGYDEMDTKSDRKIVDILTFNEKNQPVFGSQNFSYGKSLVKSPMTRYIMQYKKYAAPKLNYDPATDMIIVEHLVSESGEPERKWTLIPDGDYEGFQWINDKWVHVDKVFHNDVITPEGQAPVPVPLDKQPLPTTNTGAAPAPQN